MRAEPLLQESRTSVAIVEDDEDVAALMTDIIGDCTHYSDGPSAVAGLTGAPTIPDVVILDLELPGMHGLEVLRRLRSHPRTRRVPIVVFTSTDTDPDEGFRLGANAWVSKPNDVAQLSQAIEAIYAFWAGLNLAPRAQR